LVASLDVPLDVGLERGPPKAVEEGAARRIEPLVAELVVCVADERVASGWRGVKLMATVGLASPKSCAGDEEAACSAKETGEHITGQVGRGAPRKEVEADLLDIFVCLVRPVASRKSDGCRVVVVVVVGLIVGFVGIWEVWREEVVAVAVVDVGFAIDVFSGVVDVASRSAREKTVVVVVVVVVVGACMFGKVSINGSGHDSADACVPLFPSLTVAPAVDNTSSSSAISEIGECAWARGSLRLVPSPSDLGYPGEL